MAAWLALCQPRLAKRQAKGATVAVRHPGKLRAVPLRVFQRCVGPGTLYQSAHAPLHLRRALPGGQHHPGHLAAACRCRRLGRGHPGILQRRHGIIHLAGQLGAALTVFLHKRRGIVGQRLRVGGAVGARYSAISCAAFSFSCASLRMYVSHACVVILIFHLHQHLLSPHPLFLRTDAADVRLVKADHL